MHESVIFRDSWYQVHQEGDNYIASYNDDVLSPDLMQMIIGAAMTPDYKFICDCHGFKFSLDCNSSGCVFALCDGYYAQEAVISQFIQYSSANFNKLLNMFAYAIVENDKLFMKDYEDAERYNKRMEETDYIDENYERYRSEAITTISITLQLMKWEEELNEK